MRRIPSIHGCRDQTDGWRDLPAESSSARGGQHRSTQAQCWGSGLVLGVKWADCEGGEQKLVPAVGSELLLHPGLEAEEVVEVPPPFSSFHAPYLHSQGERRDDTSREHSHLYHEDTVGNTCVWYPHFRGGLCLYCSLWKPLLFIEGGGQSQCYHSFLIQHFSLFPGLLCWETWPGWTFSLGAYSLCAADKKKWCWSFIKLYKDSNADVHSQ